MNDATQEIGGKRNSCTIWHIHAWKHGAPEEEKLLADPGYHPSLRDLFWYLLHRNGHSAGLRQISGFSIPSAFTATARFFTFGLLDTTLSLLIFCHISQQKRRLRRSLICGLTTTRWPFLLNVHFFPFPEYSLLWKLRSFDSVAGVLLGQTV